jgi:hypothetical protein
MPSLIRTAKHAPTRGKDVDLRVALLAPGDRIKPYGDSVEKITVANGSAVAKGATSITTTALTANVIKIAKGQVLRFEDQATGKEYLAYVDEDATATDTALTVKALDEEIPDSAVAEFPAYVWDRTDSSTTKSYNFSGTTTYNTGDNEDGVVTGYTADITLPGIDYHYNDGMKTVLEAARLGQECWVSKIKPAPTDAFERGEVREGPAVLTNDSEGSAADAFQTRDLDMKWVGDIDELPAKPVA